MLSGIKLAKIIKGSTTKEDIILNEVKTLVEQKKYSVNTRPVKNAKYPETTPLIEASKRGFLNIAKYLLSKGANINATISGNQAALDYAIFSLQKKMALYLIASGANLTHVDLKEGYTPLHLAAARDLPEVVDSIIRTLPLDDMHIALNAQSSKLATPLHLCVAGQQPKNASILLRAGADFTLRDIGDTDAFVYTLAEGQLEIAKNLLEFGYCLKHSFALQGLQHSSLSIVQNSCQYQKKVPFYSLLLSAGAGLDINKVPPEILSMYNPSNKPMGPFLILGEKQLANKSRPRIVTISSIAYFKKCLENPDIKINTKQIALSLQAFEKSELEHISKIKDLLPEEVLIEAQQHYTKWLAIERKRELKQLVLNGIREAEFKRIKKLPREEWYKEYIVSKSRLDYILDTTGEFLFFLQLRLKQSVQPIRLSGLANRRVVAVLNAVVEHLHLAKSTRLQCRSLIFSECRDIISKVYGDMLLIANRLEDLQCFDENAVNMQVFELLIKNMFLHFRADLRQYHMNHLNSFIDARVGALLYVARANIKQGKVDMALNLAHKAMRENSSLMLNNEMLEVTSKHNEARAKKVFVDIYLLQGWDKKAAHLFLDVVKCYTPSAILDNGLIETAKNLLGKILNPKLQLSVLKALKRYNDTIKTDPLIKMQLHKYEKLKNLITTEVLPRLTELNCTIFHQDANLVSEYLHGLGNIKIDAERFSLTLTVSGFENLQKTIEFVVNQKYKFLNVSIPSKTFMFNLKNVNESQLTSCLKDIQNLLSSPVEIISPNVMSLQAEISGDLSKRLSQLQIHQEPVYYPDQYPEPYHPPQVKEKIKTKGKPSAKYLDKGNGDETSVLASSYGFVPIKGYGPIIPITGGYLPEETLFVTIKEGDEFLPFKSLYESGCIRSIASKGYNEQGVKLSSIISGSEKTAIARLKICGNEGKGALRAIGCVVQEVETEEGLRKLYAIKDVVHKKKEARLK